MSSSLASAPRTLIVDRPFRHKVSSYPSGRYIATVTDGRGIYYEAQDKVIQTGVFRVATVYGGLYVPVDKSESIRSWVEYEGTPIKVIGDIEGLSYHFEK
jgi:hypothetical protein